MKTFLNKAWDFLIRFRTWILNVGTAIITIVPLVVATPEFQAVLTDEQLRWVLLGNVVLNLWMRPRPAVRAKDPEAEVSRLRKETGDPPTGIGA